jgi:methionine biosynthesis protein MetW
VLDVGCGEGQLLSSLKRQKRVVGVGVEKDQDRVVEAIRRGISVVHANVDEGLSGFRDNNFDTVTLSMTLQVVEHPQLVLKEMLRVGRKCILTFPNFGHWSVRKSVALRGRSPMTANLPYSWYNTPNRHFFSIKDFQEFCRMENLHIELEAPMSGRKAVSLFPNLFAEAALYVVSNRE